MRKTASYQTVYPALTRRQQQVYEYLRDHQERLAQPPTLDELCTALGLKSRGSLHKHIQALVDAGLVEPMERKQRGIRLAQGQLHPCNTLPLLGYIAAGQPIEALENPEEIAIPDQFQSARPCYVLQVRGDSMMEDGILNGDWVIVERRDYANDREIVVALINGAETTLKRLQRKADKIVLLPANAQLSPMVFEPQAVQIQGVVIGQMRSYR